MPTNELPRELRFPDRSENASLSDIYWAHDAIARRSGDHFTCLMLGFSCRAMLRSRGISSVLVLGVGREVENTESSLAAHAWVISRNLAVSGGILTDKYIAVAAYS